MNPLPSSDESIVCCVHYPRITNDMSPPRAAHFEAVGPADGDICTSARRRRRRGGGDSAGGVTICMKRDAMLLAISETGLPPREREERSVPRRFSGKPPRPQ